MDQIFLYGMSVVEESYSSLYQVSLKTFCSHQTLGITCSTCKEIHTLFGNHKGTIEYISYDGDLTVSINEFILRTFSPEELVFWEKSSE